MKLLVKQRYFEYIDKLKKGSGGNTSKDGYTRMSLSFIPLEKEIQLTLFILS
ncbi:MAG: hypothetical protein CM15mP121_2500 [Bacteroidota bacterium]|nr:MAG: hypothetical protein CM15mP121_2500 [Bacteroidota bacterium]